MSIHCVHASAEQQDMLFCTVGYATGHAYHTACSEVDEVDDAQLLDLLVAQVQEDQPRQQQVQQAEGQCLKGCAHFGT